MKSRMTLVIAAALCLTACGQKLTLDVPPSTPASLPAIPAQLDKNPEQLPPLTDGTLGELALDNAEMTRKYGVLGTQFNTLRAFYNCVREGANNGEDFEGCTGDDPR